MSSTTPIPGTQAGARGWWVALCVAALLLAGCQSQPAVRSPVLPSPEEAPHQTATATPIPSPTAHPTPIAVESPASLESTSTPTHTSALTSTPPLEPTSNTEDSIIITTGAEQANRKGEFTFVPPAGWQLKTTGPRSELLRSSEQGSISLLLMNGALDEMIGHVSPPELRSQSPDSVIETMVDAVDGVEMVGQQDAVEIGGVVGQAVDLVGVVDDEAVMGRLAAVVYDRQNEPRAFVAFGIATGGAWEREPYDAVLESVHLTRTEQLALTATDLEPIEPGALQPVTDPSGMITIQQPASGTITITGSPGEVSYRWQAEDARAGVVVHIRKEPTIRRVEGLVAQLRDRLHSESFATAGSYLVENLPIQGRVELDYGGRGVATDGSPFALAGRAWIYQVDDRVCEVRVYAPSAQFERLWQEIFSKIHQSMQIDTTVPFPADVYSEVSSAPPPPPTAPATP